MPKESDKGRITTKTGTLLIRVIDDADGTPVSRNMTSANLATELGTGGAGTVDTSGVPVALDFARFTDADTIEGRSPAETRADLDLEVGTDLQAWSAVLDATTASFTTADETKLDGIEAAADVTDAANVAAAGAHMSGGTDVPVADGGTGASTAAGARTNLGLVIGTDVQPNDSDLTAIAALTTTAYGRGLLELANAAAMAQIGVTAGLPYVKLYTEATAATATRDVTGGTVIWINTDAGTTDPTNGAANDIVAKGV